MTANPDSALRQALDALAPFVRMGAHYSDSHPGNQLLTGVGADVVTLDDLRRAREAHALITEALQRGEK